MERDSSDEALNVVQEKDLTTFEEITEYKALLLGSTFFPGGLENLTAGKFAATRDDDERNRTANAEAALRKLTAILDRYQEQNYLLDPYLEAIVGPPVRALQQCTFQSLKGGEASSQIFDDVQRLARLLYHYTKVRGYKTILHFFPHTVDDLVPTLGLLESTIDGQIKSTWKVRYVLLLWLSLICMIPFDLAKFDKGSSTSSNTTMARIEHVGKHYLNSPGKERDAASIMLGKLYQRRDVDEEHLRNFLRWSRTSILPPSSPSTFLVTGILQTWCTIVKIASVEALLPLIEAIRSLLTLYSSDEEEAADASGGSEFVMATSLRDNSIVNKFKAKMACRLGLKILKPRKRANVLPPAMLMFGTESQERAVEKDFGEEDVPEEVDRYIALLIDALQDKDTIVRYSAAKGISRICSRLPNTFIEQIGDEITGLFAINVANIMSAKEDLSNVSEFTWQGCCIALAELARRGLLSAETLGEKMPWIERSLLFDIRRGAHSVGSGVRDAACYVLWALARAHDAEAIRPFAKSISEKLVCVALLDREISLRRAASAAYQECVGRLNLFAHGIDVIRKTDFYAVGVRRNAFLHCLPQVAEHIEYRHAIVEHLLNTTIVHWDASMRELGAQALARVVRLDFSMLIKHVSERLIAMSSIRDPFTVHGALLSLAEIGEDCRHSLSPEAALFRQKAFGTLKSVVKPGPRASGTNLVLRAACQLIASCSSADSLATGSNSWKTFVDLTLDRQEEECHFAAAKAIVAVSQLQDQTKRIRSTIQGWKRLNIAQSQSNAKVLGSYSFLQYGEALQETITFLISLVEGSSPTKSANVETRRNAYQSLADIFVNLSDRWSHSLDVETVQQIWKCLLGGMEDYSNDARGDVGSWIRIACMQSFQRIIETLTKYPCPERVYLSQSICDAICAALAKQMTERIDSVRTEARKDFLFVTRSVAGTSTHIAVPYKEKLNALFPPEQDEQLSDLSYLYGKIVPLLSIVPLRAELLKGIVLGIGPQRETVNRDLVKSLTAFLSQSEADQYDTSDIVKDLTALALANVRSNRLFVPCIQAFNVLIEEGIIDDRISESGKELKCITRMLDMATRSVNVVKSIPRLLASVQFTTNLLCITSLQSGVITNKLKNFLLHPFPIIRSTSAELIYVQGQNHLDNFTQEAEDTLLSTEWAQASISELQPIVDELIRSLSLES
ncbi:ARM repeat-containing protein [Meira miltonrushii]|uniref:ARM repeat-containing protein n=1 Tax=Meira miltonrushii TaxID=1280837 RepID=A0A316V6H8_9BASI|nr:ARM repeat-containing protein [Meira miltonrushii]PWN32854.1 ARM repeat-containing protein [Meira miltonrushii]